MSLNRQSNAPQVGFVSLAALLLAFAACSSEEVEPGMPSIVGTWDLAPGEECAAAYPTQLVFAEYVYEVPQDPERPAGPLGGGDYRIVDATTVELMAPNDAMVRYSYEMSADELVLEDSTGCRIRYVR